ncbi:hypothetical protein ACSMXM_08000 [Pacificimonas sp. ICDLI1SI03]
MIERLSLTAILRRSAGIWWRDFAPIAMLGLGLVTVPEVIMHLIGAMGATAPSTDTLVTTIRALTRLMYVGTVMAATLSSADALPPRVYMIAGLQRLQKPLITGLTVLAALIGMLIVGQLAALFLAPMARLLAVPLSLACLTIWFVAMPVAAARQTAPLAALRYSTRLIRPVKWQVFVLVAGLLLVSAAVLLGMALVIFGAGSSSDQVRTGIETMGPTTMGFWISQLVSVLLLGFLSVVPAVLYGTLSQQKGRT